MGRSTIKIKKIENKLKRNVTFEKRKRGLLKKAMEISLLCSSDVLLCLRNNNELNSEISVYSSDKPDKMITEVLLNVCRKQFFNNDDYINLFCSKSKYAEQGKALKTKVAISILSTSGLENIIQGLREYLKVIKIKEAIEQQEDFGCEEEYKYMKYDVTAKKDSNNNNKMKDSSNITDYSNTSNLQANMMNNKWCYNNSNSNNISQCNQIMNQNKKNLMFLNTNSNMNTAITTNFSFKPPSSFSSNTNLNNMNTTNTTNTNTNFPFSAFSNLDLLNNNLCNSLNSLNSNNYNTAFTITNNFSNKHQNTADTSNNLQNTANTSNNLQNTSNTFNPNNSNSNFNSNDTTFLNYFVNMLFQNTGINLEQDIKAIEQLNTLLLTTNNDSSNNSTYNNSNNI